MSAVDKPVRVIVLATAWWAVPTLQIQLDRWLQPGDVVELAVVGLGVLRNRVVRPGL